MLTKVRQHKRRIQSGKVVNVTKHWRKFNKRMKQAEEELEYVRKGKTQQDMEIGGQFQSLIGESDEPDVSSEPEGSGESNNDDKSKPETDREDKKEPAKPEGEGSGNTGSDVNDRERDGSRSNDNQ